MFSKLQRFKDRRAADIPKNPMPPILERLYGEVRRTHCGWRGCTASYSGATPAGWSSLIIHDDDPEHGTEVIHGRPMLDMTALTWRHDEVLCPEHVLALEQLLDIGTGG